MFKNQGPKFELIPQLKAFVESILSSTRDRDINQKHEYPTHNSQKRYG